MTEYNNQQQHLQNDEYENGSGLTLHDLLQMVLANWYWFALSVLICLGVAYYYLASTPKIYSRTATILVKDSRKGGDMELGVFSDLVGFQNRRNVDNEVYILQSHRLMSEVVKRLHLTVNYSVRDGLRTLDLYGRSPIEVDFIDDDNQRLSLEVTELEDGRIKLADFDDKYLTKQEKRRVIRAQYGDTIPTPLGQMVVHKTPFMDSTYVDRPITVTKSSPMVTTNAYRATVKSDVANKQASIVTISMNSSVPKRAEDVINTLIAVYEEDAIADKRQVSVVTNAFIKERMLAIGRELGVVDSEIEGIKKSNQMIDITSEATRSITESSKFKVEGLSIENQISVANYIRDYLDDPSHAGDLIPMVASLTNNGIVAQITEYNDAILRRQKLLENSSERNPVIQDMDNVLADHRFAQLARLDARNTAFEHAQGGGAGQSPHIHHAVAGESPVRHHAPAEDQGGAVPLPAQQTGGDAAQLCRRRKQFAYDRPGIRQPQARVAPFDDHPGHQPAGRPCDPLRHHLPDRHARHDHPRPQGHRREHQRPVPG